MSDELTFYDSHGTPVAYAVDDGAIYLYSGEPVAYLSADSLYDYSGSPLGFFEDGWVYDHGGACVFFTEDAVGGPLRPTRQMRPMRAMRQPRPMREARQAAPMRAMRQLVWSRLSGHQFFEP